VIEGDGFRLRRATEDDLDFLVALAGHDDVRPYMAAVSPRDHDVIAEELALDAEAPDERGRFVVEVGSERAGVMAFETKNRRSRIAWLHGIMIHPDFRGRRLADRAARAFSRHLIYDLGFHRLELEVYGFNERAIRHAERVYVREGVKRRAYRRDDEWVDGIMFGLTREDLEERNH
jgi:RimJ/RimL family protein N-acetyltransferase